MIFVPEELKAEVRSLYLAGRLSEIDQKIKEMQPKRIIKNDKPNKINSENQKDKIKFERVSTIEGTKEKIKQDKNAEEKRELEDNNNQIKSEGRQDNIKFESVSLINGANKKTNWILNESVQWIFAVCLIVPIFYYMRSCSGEEEIQAKKQNIESQISKYPVSQLTIVDYKLNMNNQNLTEIQRDSLINNYRNIRVVWTGKIKDVEKVGEYFYIEMENDFSPKNDVERLMSNGVRFIFGAQNFSHIDSVCGTVYISPTSAEDSETIMKLKKGDGFQYDGVINRISNRGCITVKPGILAKDQEVARDKGFKSEYLKQQTNNASQMLNEIKKGIEDGVSKGLEDPVKE